MAREIDQHVVEMVFDNDKFEKNARTTMSTLDKLKEKLGFGDTSDGFDKLDKAVSKLDFSSAENGIDRLTSKFSTLGVIGMTAIQNLTNRVIQMGEQLINALVFDAPKAGFQEYELQQNTIQTILSGTGEKIEEVKRQLDQLNKYADDTIYSFSDMTQNISKFTNQGIDLQTSVNAIKGISNLAADAGANAQEASHAMYNFAQALGTGYVQWIDWRSIQNAKMDTLDFKNTLVSVAGALGTVQKELDKTTGEYKYFLTKTKTKGSGKNKQTITEKTYIDAASFKDTLKLGWLTNDVLLKSLAIFAGEMSEDTLRAMGLGNEFIKLGERATEAATKIKTASQMFDTWAEAAGTGWSKSFEYIFGDFYEARDLFTSVGHKIGDEIERMSDSRNKFLEGWHKSGGYENFVAVLNGIVDTGLELKDVFGRGFMIGFLDAFSQSDAIKTAVDFTEKIKMAVETIKDSLKPNGRTDSLYAVVIGISQGIGGVLSIVSEFFTAFGSSIGHLLTMLDPFIKSVGWIVHMAGAWIADIARYIRNNKVFEKTFNSILLLMKPAVDLINTIGVKAAEAFSAFRRWAKDNKVFEKVWAVFSTVLGLAAIAINKIAEVVPKAYKRVKTFLKGVWSGVSSWAKPAFDWISEKFKKLTDIGTQIQKGDFSGINALFEELEKSFNDGVADVKKWFDENIASNPIYKSISGFFGGIIDEIGKFFTTDSNGKQITFSKDATWWDKMVAYFENGKSKAESWFNENVQPIINAISEFFAPITNAITGFFAPGTYNAGYKGGMPVTVTVTWWDKIKRYFVDGYTTAKAWFDENVDPIVKRVQAFFQPITEAIIGFFTPGYSFGFSTESGFNIKTVTWWDKVCNFFVKGYEDAKAWFDENVQPIIKAIGEFFSPITNAITGFFAPGTYNAGYKGGMPVTVTVTWWDKVKTYFNDGKEKAIGWLTAVSTNVKPITDAIGEFFKPITDKIKEFFVDGEDSETGEKIHWWTKLINYFDTGKNNVVTWFEGFREKHPIVDSIAEFFEAIIEKIKTFFGVNDASISEEDSWWERFKTYFGTGFGKIKAWFDDLRKNNPIVNSISSFFEEIGKSIAQFIQNGFKPYEKAVGMAGDRDEQVFQTFPWYQRFIDLFKEGIEKIKSWFVNLKETNPIVGAISGFFSDTWTKISNMFGGASIGEGGGTIFLNNLADQLETGVEKLRKNTKGAKEVSTKNKSIWDKVWQTVDNMIFAPASAEESMETTMNEFSNAMVNAETKAVDTVETGSKKPMSVLDLLSKILSLTFEGFLLMWQNLSNTISTMKFDALWAFLDKLKGYWTAFTLGNLTIGVRNITELMAHHQRNELLESVTKMIGALAVLAGEVVGFATLDDTSVAKGLSFLTILLVGVGALMVVASKTAAKGGGSTTAISTVNNTLEAFSGSIGKTIGSAAFLGAITALVGAVSGALKDIASLSKDGITADDMWSAIGYLAMGMTAVYLFSMLFSGGSGILGSIINKIGSPLASKLGFSLTGGISTQKMGDSSVIQKALQMTGSGVSNLATIASLAMAMKAFTGALIDVQNLMKDNDWHTIEDAMAELEFLGGLVLGLVLVLNVDNFLSKGTDKLLGRSKLPATVDGGNSIDWKGKIAESLKSAADILSIAESAKILVDALEAITRLDAVYGKDKVDEAYGRIKELFSMVFVSDLINQFVDKASTSKWGQGSSPAQLNAFAAAFSQNSIAMAAAVWMLVDALGKIMELVKRLDEGEDLEYYMVKLGEIVLSVLASDVAMKLIDKIKTNDNAHAWLGLVPLLVGVGGFILSLQWLMNIMGDDTNKYVEAGKMLGKIVIAMVGGLAGVEGLAYVADKIPAKAQLLIAGLALLLGGLVYLGGNAAEQFGEAFTQISAGVKSIADTITGIPDKDIPKIEAFGNAVSSLADAQAAVSGVKYAGGFLDRALTALLTAAGVDTSNGENLETLGKHTQGFSEYIPGILENIKGINRDIQVFDAFIGFVEDMAVLQYISHELAGGWELTAMAGELNNASGQLGTAVSTLANHKDDYEAAMSGLWFIQEFTEYAKQFRYSDEIKEGLLSLDRAMLEITSSDVPSYIGVLASQIADGFVSEDKNLVGKVSGVINNLVTNVRGKYNDFFTAGKYFAEGLANGMLSLGSRYDMRAGSVYYAGYTLAQTALQGISDGSDSHSPSREAYKYGDYMVLGFVNAMNNENYLAYDEGTALASEALMGMRSVLSDDLASSMNDDFLTIRPVMDMSDIQNGMDTIDAYTHRYGEYAYGAWKGSPTAPQHEFGSYSSSQASTLGENDSGIFASYDDSRVVAILSGLNGKMDSLSELSEKLDNLQLVLDSGALVGGIASKMNRRLGVIASREERRN